MGYITGDKISPQIQTVAPVDKKEEIRCMYCSELANGTTSSGAPSCGDEACGEIETFFQQ